MKKRIFSIALCVVLALALFCGCISDTLMQDPLSRTFTEDPLLLAMREALLAEDADVRIDTPQTQQGGYRVEVDQTLMEKLITVLTTSPAETITVPSVEGGFESITVQEHSMPVIIQLFGKFAPQDEFAGRTMVWVQVGEENAQFLYDETVYTQIEELVNASTVPNDLALEGEYTALQISAQLAERLPGEAYPIGCVQIGDILILAFVSDGRAYLELVRMPDGQSFYFEEFDAEPLRLEKADSEPYNYRLFFRDGSVAYRSTQDLTATYTYQMPPEAYEEMSAVRFYADFDVDLESDTLVYTTEQGIRMRQGGRAPTLLYNDAITSAMLGGFDLDNLPPEDEFSPMYAEPRILNGSKTISACLMLPGSQSGYASLVLYDPATGGEEYYTDIFGAMYSGVTYLDDTRLVAHGNDADTMIDAKTGQSTEFPRREMYEDTYIEQYTADYETFVYSIYASVGGADENRYFYETPDDAFFITRGGNVYMMGITPEYMLLRDTASQQLYAVPY